MKRELRRKEREPNRNYSPYYYLSEPIVLTGEEESISLRYKPAKHAGYFELFSSQDGPVRYPLPGGDGAGRLREHSFAVTGIREIAGFRFASDEGPPASCSALILGRDPEKIKINDEIFISSESWNANITGEGLQVRGEGVPPLLEIRYRYNPADTEEILNGVQLRLGSEDDSRRSKEWRIYLKRGDHSVYLFPWMYGDSPPESPVYHLEMPRSGFKEISISPGTLPADFLEPIPADPAAIMDYPEGQWRDREFELFSWNIFPEILIFDTLDYGVQAAMFKRLAFYVEKHGYTGRILKEDELKGLHGWNAHDYRSIDLASFFQAADDRRAELNRYELLLREILLHNEIISYDGSRKLYLPSQGGVISISRSSTDYLRKLFLFHEGMHGIFFASSAYRDGCFGMWNTLSEDLKDYFYAFFRWMKYDIGNSYLIVNEMQAYLLQQNVSAVEYYFRNHRSLPALLKNPDREEGIQALLSDETAPFRDAAERNRDILYETTGVWHDRFFCLEPEPDVETQ